LRKASKVIDNEFMGNNRTRCRFGS
jgi:hypothetical protein